MVRPACHAPLGGALARVGGRPAMRTGRIVVDGSICLVSAQESRPHNESAQPGSIRPRPCIHNQPCSSRPGLNQGRVSFRERTLTLVVVHGALLDCFSRALAVSRRHHKPGQKFLVTSQCGHRWLVGRSHDHSSTLSSTLVTHQHENCRRSIWTTAHDVLHGLLEGRVRPE